MPPMALQPVALGQVLPAGWLRRQLRVQADGIGGHLDEFWPRCGREQRLAGRQR